MVNFIILALVLAAMFFAGRYAWRKAKKGECVGCSGCKGKGGGCPGKPGGTSSD